MLTFFWLCVWVFSGLPRLDFDPFTDWTIALCIAVALDAVRCRAVVEVKQ